MSPSELSRTIKKRCSGMRRLADGFEKLARRGVFGVAHDGYADPEPSGHVAFWDGVGGVVPTLGMYIRPQLCQKSLHVGFGEKHDVIDATKRGDKQRAGVFIEDGPARSFQIADAGVGVHADDKKVTFAAGALQISKWATI